MLNSRYPLACAPPKRLPAVRASFFRRYGGNLPSSFNTLLSSALVYSTSPPVSVSGTDLAIKGRRGCFLEPLRSLINPIRSDNTRDPSHTSGLRNINRISIDYPLRARLRDRLTLRGLALRRNPWAFGDRASHPVYRYSCQHSHFRYLHGPLPGRFTGLRNAPLPHAVNCTPKASVHVLSPVTFSPQDLLFRPVSCYAFFKGWLLLSQPPGCFGIPTCFPT